jgi:hypothetical protein
MLNRYLSGARHLIGAVIILAVMVPAAARPGIGQEEPMSNQEPATAKHRALPPLDAAAPAATATATFGLG